MFHVAEFPDCTVRMTGCTVDESIRKNQFFMHHVPRSISGATEKATDVGRLRIELYPRWNGGASFVGWPHKPIDAPDEA